MTANKKDRADKDGGGDHQGSIVEEIKKPETSSEQFKRPSDYRRASLQMQDAPQSKEGIMIKITEESEEALGGEVRHKTFEALATDTPTKDAFLSDMVSLLDIFTW